MPFIRNLIAPFLPARPTTDLYFLNACRSGLGRYPLLGGVSGAPLRRIGANSFLTGHHAVVSRGDAPAVVDAILRDDTLQLTYVIDDDLAAAESDASLPTDYRDRLIALRDGQHRALVARADTIVVCSDHLAERYRSCAAEVKVLDPYWSDRLADDWHFAAMQEGGLIDVAYLGSVTHGADRAFVFEVMAHLLERNARMRLTLISSKPLGNALDHHARVRRLRPLPWWLYRHSLRRRRYHLALYPMLDTPFNRGRSLNKLIEHAVVGAVGVYSRDWCYADRVTDGETGFLAENTVDAWVAAVELALADPQKLRRMQGKARAAATLLNDPAPQRRFWSERLEFNSS